jgi:Na+/melibiose symporter-like transporter
LTTLYGIGLSATGGLLWQFASQISINHAVASGERSDGLVFGLVIFTIQLSIGLSTLWLGLACVDEASTGSPPHSAYQLVHWV